MRRSQRQSEYLDDEFECQNSQICAELYQHANKAVMAVFIYEQYPIMGGITLMLALATKGSCTQITSTLILRI